MTRLVVFVGHKGAGKDTAGNVFLETFGWHRLALAEPLKAMIRTLMTLRGCPNPHRYTDGDLKEAPNPYLNGCTTRKAMQLLGTEWGRECVSPTLWLDTWRDIYVRSCHTAHGIVVTDCRFQNEAEYLKREGAEFYLVRRPGKRADGAEHSSEDLEWAFDMADAGQMEALWNDFPSAGEFQDSIRARFFN